MSEIKIDWDWNGLINEPFKPLINNKDRYLILYGGRGSSKSDFAAKKLIYRCLFENYFRCVCVRNTYSTLKDSSYKTLKDIIIDLGLESLFTFKVQPLEIVCQNGNSFIFKGCDSTTKLKSIKDPSAVWFEEDIPNEKDFITITTSVRTSKADYLQEIYTINPEVEGNYQDHWFYKLFFADHSTQKTFSDRTIVKIGKDKQTELTYTCHHSTYADNKYIPNEFIGFLENMKYKNPYYYSIYCAGNWGNKETGGLYHKHFNRSTNTSTEITYNPDLALFLSVDFNVNPFCSATIWQIDEDKNVLCIDEIASLTPNNNTKGICKEFIRKYASHGGGLFIMGDASGRNKDTRSEQGHNDFKILETELRHFKPVVRVPSKNPSIVMRGNFINTLFLGEIKGINVTISDKCIHLITDLINLKEDSDGGTKKEKTNENGVTFEKWGHHSDTLAYFLCEALRTDYSIYQHGCEKPKPILVFKSYNPKTNY